MASQRSLVLAGVATIVTVAGLLTAREATVDTSAYAQAPNAQATPVPTPGPGKRERNVLTPDQIKANDIARRQQFTKQFLPDGGDPRSLQRLTIPASAPSIASLEDAVATADTVVVGSVERTTFAPHPLGGVPLATAIVRVTQTIKGNAPVVVAVRQLGGPELTTSGPVLIQLDTETLLLPGDEAVIFGQHQRDAEAAFNQVLPASGGGFHTLPRAGVYLVRNGQVVPSDSNPFRQVVAGKTTASFLADVQRAAAAPPRPTATVPPFPTPGGSAGTPVRPTGAR